MTTKSMLEIMMIGSKNKTLNYTIFIQRHIKDTAQN